MFIFHACLFQTVLYACFLRDSCSCKNRILFLPPYLFHRFFAQTCQNRQWKMMAIFVFLLHDAHKSLPILYSLDVKIDWMVHIYYPAYSTNSSEKLHIIFAFTTFFCSSISYDPSNWVSMDIWSFSSIWVPTIHLPSSQQGNVLTENCNCNTV